MGYNLYIGEFDVVIEAEDRCAWVTARVITLNAAPVNSSGFRSGKCWPSYTAWGESMRRAGLRDVFYPNREGSWWVDGDGVEHDCLLAHHPGARALTPAHLRRFEAALAAHRPGGWGTDKSTGIDYQRRRLEWLVWWTRWALENCEYPTFANS